jgi:hypothetical protein
MTTRIVEFCAVWSKCREINHCAVHSATLKKFALGKGRGDKAEMIAAAQKRLRAPAATALWFKCLAPAAQLSEHEADALWLYWYAKDKYGASA